MHICLVSDDFLPKIGGISQHIYEIARCFTRMGHNVTVVNQVMQSRPEEIEDLEGIRVVRASFTSALPKIRVIPYSFRLKRLILREHQRMPIDVLHWHDLAAGFAIKHLSLRCRTVFTNHSSTFLKRIHNPIYRRLYRYSLRHADRLLAPSQELVDETEELLDRSVSFIPNGFDPQRFQPMESASLRSELGISADEKVLLAPRRLAPKNGVYVLAESLPRILQSHPGARVVISGGGFPAERARIESFAGKHGCLDRILFLDGVDNKHMPQHYDMADLVIMPSFMEAVSLSALEAMACRKCVVASDVGGLSQLFEGQRWGKLVPPGDPDALASVITNLLSDDQQRDALADAARKHVLSRYTWEQIATQTFEGYDANAA